MGNVAQEPQSKDTTADLDVDKVAEVEITSPYIEYHIYEYTEKEEKPAPHSSEPKKITKPTDKVICKIRYQFMKKGVRLPPPDDDAQNQVRINNREWVRYVYHRDGVKYEIMGADPVKMTVLEKDEQAAIMKDRHGGDQWGKKYLHPDILGGKNKEGRTKIYLVDVRTILKVISPPPPISKEKPKKSDATKIQYGYSSLLVDKTEEGTMADGGILDAEGVRKAVGDKASAEITTDIESIKDILKKSSYNGLELKEAINKLQRDLNQIPGYSYMSPFSLPIREAMEKLHEYQRSDGSVRCAFKTDTWEFDRYYTCDAAFASCLGMMLSTGYVDLTFNGGCQKNGDGDISKTHGNGQHIDFRPLRKDLTGDKLDMEQRWLAKRVRLKKVKKRVLEAEKEKNRKQFDIERQIIMNKAALKFGWLEILFWRYEGSGTKVVVPNVPKATGAHGNHVHYCTYNPRKGDNPILQEMEYPKGIRRYPQNPGFGPHMEEF